MPQENSASASRRLLLVADHDELRGYIAQLLRRRIKALEISEAVDRREAVQLARLRQFQVIIVDLDPDNALRLAMDLQRVSSEAQLFLLSRLGDEGLKGGDLPLVGALIVPRHSIGAVLPESVQRALVGGGQLA